MSADALDRTVRICTVAIIGTALVITSSVVQLGTFSRVLLLAYYVIAVILLLPSGRRRDRARRRAQPTPTEETRDA